LSWLQVLRGAVVRKADGLTDGDARWRPEGSLIPIARIGSHRAHVEWRWIEGRLRGEPRSRSEDEFTVPPGRPPAVVVASNRA
jgi:hypothetical protein